MYENKNNSKYAPSVVQCINQNTDNQYYQRIPKKQFSEFKSLFGGSDGIAGENINGKVYHLTARNPKDMEKKGFKSRGVAKVADYRGLEKFLNSSQ